MDVDSVGAVGWGCFEMGFSRKVDPEPGRCRRTDGKKWRCSKEAYPDSKYCERHMHRGRNRSRKPVEILTTTTTTSTPSTITSPPNISSVNMNRSLSTTTPTISTYSSLSYPIPSEPLSHLNPQHNSSIYPFLYSHSSSSRPTGCGLLPENNNTPHFSLKAESYTQPDKDYRFVMLIRTYICLHYSKTVFPYSTVKTKFSRLKIGEKHKQQ